MGHAIFAHLGQDAVWKNCPCMGHAQEKNMGEERLHIIDLKKFRVDDPFWSRHVDLVRKEIIPYQWDAINDNIPGAEPSHSLKNFEIAAGRRKGEFYGMVFQDTDVAKWLEAVGFTLASYDLPDLEKTADEVIGLIGEAQQPDGYLDTYFIIKEPGRKWKDLCEGHELYTAGHMMEAAAAYYLGTGKRKFLDITTRLADLLCRTFGPEEGKIHGYPGHEEVEVGLCKLYRVTGERRYLDLAKYFIDSRGVGENYFVREMEQPGFTHIFPDFNDYDTTYSQSDRPVREQDKAEGHAVRAMYLYSAMADLAGEYDDPELLEACRRLFWDVTKKQMYITGSIGSSGILERFTTDYDLPNDRNYSESCASVGLAMFGSRMARITRDASYIGAVERALYNTVLAGIALDGKSFFYVNPLEIWPENCIPRTSMEHVKPIRQKWFGVACCPPNIARTLASLGQYAYSASDTEIFLNLFMSNQTSVDLKNGTVDLDVKTAFPFGDEVTVKVSNVPEGGFDLAVRVPEYAEEFGIREGEEGKASSAESTGAAGKAAAAESVGAAGKAAAAASVGATGKAAAAASTGAAGKAAVAESVGAAGKASAAASAGAAGKDSCVSCRVEKGYAYLHVDHDTTYTITIRTKARFVRANPNVRADCGKVAIVKGPLVYCLEEKDNGKNLAEIFVSADQKIEEVPSKLFGGVTLLKLKGKRMKEDAWSEDELYAQHKVILEEVDLTAVPYPYWNNRGVGEMTVWMKELL